MKTHQHFVEYLNSENKLTKGWNQHCTKVKKTHISAISANNKQIYKDCIVQIEKGIKKGQTFRVKKIHGGYLFLH